MPSSRKRRLDKSTLSLTFKFDSDRFLRFRLATDEERSAIGESQGVTLQDAISYRPGIAQVLAAGRRWEADKYEDLIRNSGVAWVHFERKPDVDEEIGRRPFEAIPDIFGPLRAERPPLAIIEGQFGVPSSITPALERAYDEFGLDAVRARPDILWIRPGGTGSPLIGRARNSAPFEIHVIDVKMAAEPSLRHFTEVTFYALALERALKEEGLDDRYAVSAEGFIWPGSHDANAFRNQVRHHQSRGHADPLTAALLDTLKAVPYEVYHVHVRQFFEERLPRVMRQEPLEVPWHVGPTCQLCEYLGFCQAMAESEDHLSRIAWLTAGQAEALRQNGIHTTAELADALRAGSQAWHAATETNHQLRADGPALLARAEALQHNKLRIAEGRKAASMPRFTEMNIFLSVHYDMGSGITFAIGARRVYFRPDAATGTPPQREEDVFVVDRMVDLNPDVERARLVEFLNLVMRWLTEAHDYNVRLHAQRRAAGERDRPQGKVRVHFFVWDTNELRQLRRMLERHMQHEDVVGLVEVLVRMFPPEKHLPDPTAFRSQPGTAVKEVFKQLVGVPVPHNYTLLDTANAFYPNMVPDPDNPGSARPYVYRLPYGFITEMSDQIPFERAYELWSGRVHLTRRDRSNPHVKILYTWRQVLDGIANAVTTRISALDHLVGQLRRHHGDLLVLRKSPFSVAPPVRMRGVPEQARQLNALEQLDVAAAEIENRAVHALPVDEREARFHSMRGLRPAGAAYDAVLDEVRRAGPRYATRQLAAFTFAPTSRDARVREGDFTLALSNEDPPGDGMGDPLDLHAPWRNQIGYDADRAEQEIAFAGLKNWLAHAPLKHLLEVEVARLEAAADPPFVVLAVKHPDRFSFAEDHNLVNLDQALVLDPLQEDFSSEQVEQVLRAVGQRRHS